MYVDKKNILYMLRHGTRTRTLRRTKNQCKLFLVLNKILWFQNNVLLLIEETVTAFIHTENNIWEMTKDVHT